MKGCNRLVDVGRRQFLTGTGAAAAGAAAATVMPREAHAAAKARVDYPSNKLANVKDLKVNDPVDITYPDADSPGVLIKLGTKVPGGSGPDGDIVAYSTFSAWPTRACRSLPCGSTTRVTSMPKAWTS